jgi:cell wall-associated NlpC family hydrolase
MEAGAERSERRRIEASEANRLRPAMKRNRTNPALIVNRSAVFVVPVSLVAAAVILSGLCGCSAVPGTRPAVAGSITPQQWACLPESTRRERLLRVYERFEGVRHRLGGTGRRGMDCSAFAREVYREAVGAELPRTTVAQSRVGVAVERKDLHVGDLVLFRPKSYPRHVGVYVGDGRFIHVSSQRGVISSAMNDGYWSRNYWTARRLREAVICKR